MRQLNEKTTAGKNLANILKKNHHLLVNPLNPKDNKLSFTEIPKDDNCRFYHMFFLEPNG